MRIGVDISPLKSGHAGRGTGTYTRSLLIALKQYHPEHQIVEFADSKEVPNDVDIVHYPYFDPFLLTLPLKRQKPTIVTVHDLIPIAFPKHFPKGVKGEFRWQLQKVALKHATAILTDSNSSKDDIVRLLPYNEKRVHVAYLAPGDQYLPQSKSEQDRVRKKYSLPNQYLLYVGDVNWNKNIPGLVRSISPIGVPLVCVGKAFLDTDLAETKEMNSLINSLSLNDKIIRLGFVPEDDLPAVYTAAAVHVQPSFAEGFGLPVLEAMACGTISVVANTTSLKEIAGPSVLVNPEDDQDITSGIKKALSRTKPDYKDVLSEWVKQYSWEKTAQNTLEAYQSLIV